MTTPRPAELGDRSSELFGETYSPARVRFYLAHWEELETLAAGGSSGLAGYLQREWVLLRSRRTDVWLDAASRRRDCLCHEQHTYADEGARGGGGTGDAAGRVRRIIADLEQAADALPVPWRATEAVYRIQQRYAHTYRLRLYRYRQNLQVRDRDRWPEPEHSGIGLAARMMASSLGWRPLSLVPTITDEGAAA